MVRDARRCRAPHHEGPRPHPEERRRSLSSGRASRGPVGRVSKGEATELDDGAIVYIENVGIRFGPKELLDRIAKGEIVDPALIYFRSVPKFETGTEKYRWLMENLFVGVGARYPDRVEIDVHQVL